MYSLRVRVGIVWAFTFIVMGGEDFIYYGF